MNSSSTPLSLFYIVENEGGATGGWCLICCDLKRNHRLEFEPPGWQVHQVGTHTDLVQADQLRQCRIDLRKRVEQINLALHWWRGNVRGRRDKNAATSAGHDSVRRPSYLDKHFDDWSCRLLAFGAVIIGGPRRHDKSWSLLHYCVKKRGQYLAIDRNKLSLLYVAVLQERIEQVRVQYERTINPCFGAGCCMTLKWLICLPCQYQAKANTRTHSQRKSCANMNLPPYFPSPTHARICAP